MYLFESVSRPILFEAQGDFLYWGKGSSFLVATQNNYYLVTARHVLENQAGLPESLRVIPCDGAKAFLPTNQVSQIKIDDQDDDYADIIVLRIDIPAFDEHSDAPLVAQPVETGFMPAEELVSGSELWIIGYPSEASLIDHDAMSMSRTRSVIRAIYRREGISSHCHFAEVETSINLTSFDGLSGSPVFFLRPTGEEYVPVLVGMLLRGTAESSFVHFLSARLIGNFIQLIEQSNSTTTDQQS